MSQSTSRKVISTLVPAAWKGPIRRGLVSLGLYPDNTPVQERHQADWAAILGHDSAAWQAACAAAKDGPSVLLVDYMGVETQSAMMNTTLAVALTLRGARVHLLLCDEALPACAVARIGNLEPQELVAVGPSQRLCGTCFSPTEKLFQSFGLPIHRFRELLTPDDVQQARTLSSELPISEIGDYELDGVDVGRHALCSAVRYYVRGSLGEEPLAQAVLRRYFNASLLTTAAVRRLLNTASFRAVCALDGMYVPMGLVGAAARRQKVRVVNWATAYRKQSFIFSHVDTFHQTLVSEPTTHWEGMTWTPEMETAIVDYLKSRWYGTRDWIGYTESPQDDVAAIAAEFGIDFAKPCIGLLTNIVWEGEILYRGTVFPNMLEWTLATIRYFAERPDVQLIIRVHPAEVRASSISRQPIMGEISRVFPTLPKNVFIIPPESRISTYATMSKCDTVIIYGTKTGIELAAMGIPVIVAGGSWIRNKGVAMDADSPQEYFALLDRLPLNERLSSTKTRRALKYAYHFFLRRMIPLSFTTATPGWPPFRLTLSSLDELLPGQSLGLDLICNGILNGDEFIYPAELLPEVLQENS
jgi:hypothetical protein